MKKKYELNLQHIDIAVMKCRALRIPDKKIVEHLLSLIDVLKEKDEKKKDEVDKC